jgi:hypothetical protein
VVEKQSKEEATLLDAAGGAAHRKLVRQRHCGDRPVRREREREMERCQERVADGS